MTDGLFILHEFTVDTLLSSPAGPVGEFLNAVTEDVTAGAKRRAPVGEPSKTPEGRPAGYLRDQIEWHSVEGMANRVTSPATNSTASPFPGEHYGTFNELPDTRPRKPPPFARDNQPYMWPAAVDVWADRFGL